MQKKMSIFLSLSLMLVAGAGLFIDKPSNASIVKAEEEDLSNTFVRLTGPEKDLHGGFYIFAYRDTENDKTYVFKHQANPTSYGWDKGNYTIIDGTPDRIEKSQLESVEGSVYQLRYANDDKGGYLRLYKGTKGNYALAGPYDDYNVALGLYNLDGAYEYQMKVIRGGTFSPCFMKGKYVAKIGTGFMGFKQLSDSATISCFNTSSSSYSNETDCEIYRLGGTDPAPVLQNIYISGTPKTEYYQYDYITKPTIMAKWSSGDDTDVSSSVSSNFNDKVKVLGNQTVTFSYTSGGVTKTCTLGINVSRCHVSYINIYQNSSYLKTDYERGNEFKRPRIEVHYTNTAAPTNLWLDDPEVILFSGYNMDVCGTYEVTCSFHDVLYDEWFACSYKITVREPSLVSIAFSKSPKTTIAQAATYKFNGEVEATYSNGEKVDVTESCSVEYTGNTDKVGNILRVTVTYLDKSLAFDVEVVALVLDGITIISYPTQREFIEGTSFNHQGIQVMAYYNDHEYSKEVTSSCTYSGYNLSVLGEQTVTVSYATATATYPITVVAKSVESISLSYESIEINAGEELTLPIVTAYYNNNTQEVIEDGYQVSDFNTSIPGEFVITITYQGMTATFNLKINKVSSGGCGGSIATTSILLSITALSLLVVLFLRRRFVK